MELEENNYTMMVKYSAEKQEKVTSLSLIIIYIYVRAI